MLRTLKLKPANVPMACLPQSARGKLQLIKAIFHSKNLPLPPPKRPYVITGNSFTSSILQFLSLLSGKSEYSAFEDAFLEKTI